jgi:hypothetical protein
MCLKEGKAMAAHVADHVVPHRGDWNKFVLGVLQSLCYTHHNAVKKEQENRGYATTIGIDGWPVDERHPVYGNGVASQADMVKGMDATDLVG